MSRILMNEKKKFKISKKILVLLAIVIVVLTTILYILITESGHWLIQDQEFNHVKWAVILDGQTAEMERNDYVAKLMKAGKVDSVLILGRRILRDKSNADFYAEDFLNLGDFDAKRIYIVHHDDPSTIAEAKTIIPWFKKRNTDSVLIVTAPQATMRATRIFRKLSGSKPVFFTTDIQFFQYNPESWIFNRESRKLWLHEMAAYLNSFLDLWHEHELTAADFANYENIFCLADKINESMVDLQTLIPQVDQRIDSLKRASQADSTAADSAGTSSSTGSSK